MLPSRMTRRICSRCWRTWLRRRWARKVAFDEAKLFLLREHRFYHGNAAVAGRVLLFFYFQEADTGIAALIPGTRGAMEVARFRLTAGLADPRKN